MLIFCHNTQTLKNYSFTVKNYRDAAYRHIYIFEVQHLSCFWTSPNQNKCQINMEIIKTDLSNILYTLM